MLQVTTTTVETQRDFVEAARGATQPRKNKLGSTVTSASVLKAFETTRVQEIKPAPTDDLREIIVLREI